MLRTVVTISNPSASSGGIAVLGGGISGIAAAFWLTELMPGAKVTVFESANRLGGLIGTLRQDGFLLETGPLAFPTVARATGALMRSAGLSAACLPSRMSGGIALWNGLEAVSVPKGMLDALRRRILPVRTLARLLLEPFIPKPSPNSDPSIVEFFRRRTGMGFFETLLEPMTAGILAGDPSVLSMAANLPRVHGMERNSGSLALGYWKDRIRSRSAQTRNPADLPTAATARDGCGALIEALAAVLRARGVALRLSTPIRSITRAKTGAAIRFTLLSGPEGKEEVQEFSSVVSALPSHRLAPLADDWPAEAKSFLAGIPHAPLSLVYLAYPKHSPDRGFTGEGLLPQACSGEDILSCFLPSRMGPDRCPNGFELLRVLIGGARKPHLAGLDDSQAEGLASRAARRMLGLRDNPSLVKVLRHEAGLAQLNVGHLAALARTHSALARDWPGFVLAGTSVHGPGIENAVASGRKAAELLADLLSAGNAGKGNLHVQT